MLPMTGFSPDESFLDDNKPAEKVDHFEAALAKHGVPSDVEDFTDLPEKSAPKGDLDTLLSTEIDKHERIHAQKRRI